MEIRLNVKKNYIVFATANHILIDQIMEAKTHDGKSQFPPSNL